MEIKKEDIYSLANGGFQIKNGKRYYNRPLYGADHISKVLVGDKPVALMDLAIHGGKMGNLLFGIITEEGGKWFQDFEKIIATYIPGIMKYELNDKLLAKAEISMEIVPLSDVGGFIVRLRGEHFVGPFRIIWMFGGASGYGMMINALWEEEYLQFHPQDCIDNIIELKKGYFWLEGRDTRLIQREDAIKDPEPGRKSVFGKTNFNGIYRICEASRAKLGPNGLIEKSMRGYNLLSTNLPSVVTFETELLSNSFEGYVIISLSESFIKKELKKPQTLFSFSVDHYRRIAHKIVVKTPDSYLDKVVEAMCLAMNACWYSPSFMHGARMWMAHYLGWRVYYGPECFGWHDRVRESILAHSQGQIKKGLEKGAIPSVLGSHNSFYNMNEVFLDQIIYHYHWTGNKTLMKEIFPVLKGILQWQKRTFDPDDDGLYENSLNTWISDYHWYYGGGCTQSSAYTWRANHILAQIAEDIGKDGRVYQEEAKKIHQALFNVLWLKKKGHFAEYKDTFGLKRIHKEPELASIYHPIEFYLTDEFQSYQMLRWLENSLETIKCNLHREGRLLWSSNWRPTRPDGYQHASRDPAVAESLNTALAYYRINSTEKAYELLMGAVISCYIGDCPGGIMYKPVGSGFLGGIKKSIYGREYNYRGGAVDFTDTVSMFSRVIIEGLFGIIPEMQNNRVLIMPGFPLDWENAQLKTEDIEVEYQKEGHKERLKVMTTRSTEKVIKIIAKYPSIKDVRLNKKTVRYEVIPSINHPLICVYCPLDYEADIEIDYGINKYSEITYTPIAVRGENYFLEIEGNYRVVHLKDPQEILSDVSMSRDEIKGKIIGGCGQHTFFLLIQDKDISYWKPIDIEIKEGLEIKNLCFDPSKREYSYQLCNNFTKVLTLKITSFFLDDKREEKIQISGNFVHSFTYQIKNVACVTPGTNLLFVSTEGDKNVKMSAFVKCWDILRKLPKQKKNFLSRCSSVSLKDFYDEKVSDIFKQKYLSPKPIYRDFIRPNGLSQWNSKEIVPDTSWMRKSIQEGKYLTNIGIPFQQVREGKNVVFVSIWDNFSTRVKIPIRKRAHKIYFLICGTTFPMQSQIANGRLVVHYTDGQEQQLDLINPINYDDSLADFGYYHYTGNGSQRLGKNTHADILDIILDANKIIEYIKIEALSNQVVIGLLGVTLL